MTPDTASLPIAPETSCCSETSPVVGGLPIVSAQPVDGDCCQTASPAVSGVAPLTSAHGESCSNHGATVSVVETPIEAAAATEQDGVGQDDAALIGALREVIDPELMINIVDLGLVYSINQTDRKVLVEMTLTSPACPAGPQIISQAKMSLEKLDGVDVAEIKLTMSPPWTPDRMTDDARDQLGIF